MREALSDGRFRFLFILRDMSTGPMMTIKRYLLFLSEEISMQAFIGLDLFRDDEKF